jgi:SPP1 gp7 family putative phage head morphogenesis protein
MSFEGDQKKVFDLAEKQVADAEKLLKTSYLSSLKSVKEQLQVFYQRYSDNRGKLTHATAVKFDRLIKLEKSINAELKKLGVTTSRIIKGGIADDYVVGYSGYWYAIEQELNIPFNFGRINKDAVFEQANLQGYANLLNNLLTDLGRESINKINNTLISGLIEGSGITEVAREMAKQANISLNRAIRITRTEMLRSYSLGYLKSHDRAVQLGIKVKKKWVATLDSRVRDSHARADGQVTDDLFKLSEPAAKMPAPRVTTVTAHAVNCRCTSIDVIDGVNDKIKTRIEQDRFDSKFDNYENWFNALKKGEKRFNNK